MSLNLWAMLASLKMGVDLAPDTDPEDVPHTVVAGYVPVYSVETCWYDAWRIWRAAVPPEELPAVVESMHCAFDCPVRLLEDGHPVFTVDGRDPP